MASSRSSPLPGPLLPPPSLPCQPLGLGVCGSLRPRFPRARIGSRCRPAAPGPSRPAGSLGSLGPGSRLPASRWRPPPGTSVPLILPLWERSPIRVQSHWGFDPQPPTWQTRLPGHLGAGGTASISSYVSSPFLLTKISVLLLCSVTSSRSAQLRVLRRSHPLAMGKGVRRHGPTAPRGPGAPRPPSKSRIPREMSKN